MFVPKNHSFHAGLWKTATRSAAIPRSDSREAKNSRRGMEGTLQLRILLGGVDDPRRRPGSPAREERRHRVEIAVRQRNALRVRAVRIHGVEARLAQLLRVHEPEDQLAPVAGPFGDSI